MAAQDIGAGVRRAPRLARGTHRQRHRDRVRCAGADRASSARTSFRPSATSPASSSRTRRWCWWCAAGGRAASLFTRPATRGARCTTASRPTRPPSRRRPVSPARSIAALAPMLDCLANRAFRSTSCATTAAPTTARATRSPGAPASCARFLDGHRGVDDRDAHPILDSLRARKSPAELALLRRAIDVTVGGAARGDARHPARACTSTRSTRCSPSAFRRTGGDGPGVRLDHRLGPELHPVPLRAQQPPDGRRATSW